MSAVLNTNLMKQLLLAGLAATTFFTTNTAFAQTDAKAKSVLDAVSKKVSTLKTLKAGFTLKFSGAGGKGMANQSGSFLMKGVKYHVTLAKQEIICDGKTVWTYMKDAKEVQVSNYNPAEQTISPTKLFSNFYDKEYKYRYLGPRAVGGKSCDIIELVPNDASKQLTKLELAIDKNSTIAGGTVYQKNGGQTQYTVSGYTPNAPVTDAQFTFDTKQHPGVEVVDLR